MTIINEILTHMVLRQSVVCLNKMSTNTTIIQEKLLGTPTFRSAMYCGLMTYNKDVGAKFIFYIYCTQAIQQKSFILN